MQMDRSNTLSEISFHGLPSKSIRPTIRKQIASLLSSQLKVLLFLRHSHLQRDIQQTFFRQYFCELLENSRSASKKHSKNFYKVHKKISSTKSCFSKIAGFYKSSHRRQSVKKVFLERCSQNSQENTCVRDSILIKLQA